jgi:primosomal protein N' (replication factor Y)
MTQNLNIPVLGPEEPAINRIRNEYIRTIIIKIPINTSIVSTKDRFKKMLNSFDSVAQYRAIRVGVNVDFLLKYFVTHKKVLLLNLLCFYLTVF